MRQEILVSDGSFVLSAELNITPYSFIPLCLYPFMPLSSNGGKGCEWGLLPTSYFLLPTFRMTILTRQNF